MAKNQDRYQKALSNASMFIGVEKTPNDIRSAVAHMKINERAQIMHSFADGYPDYCSNIPLPKNVDAPKVSLSAGTWNLGRNIIRSILP